MDTNNTVLTKAQKEELFGRYFLKGNPDLKDISRVIEDTERAVIAKLTGMPAEEWLEQLRVLLAGSGITNGAADDVLQHAQGRLQPAASEADTCCRGLAPAHECRVECGGTKVTTASSEADAVIRNPLMVASGAGAVPIGFLVPRPGPDNYDFVHINRTAGNRAAWDDVYRLVQLLAAQPTAATADAQVRCRKCGEMADIIIKQARIVTHWPDGTPRDERDIASDPEGKLIHDPSEPLKAADAQGDERAAFEARGQAINDIHKAIDAYIEDYEMRGEDGEGRDVCYTPNENERALLLDAINGLLADDDFNSAQHRWFVLSRPPSAPASALGQYSYQQIFDAIAAATSASGNVAVHVSVEAFRAALAAAKQEVRNAAIPDDWVVAAQCLLDDAEDGDEPTLTLTARQIVDAAKPEGGSQ